MHEIRDTLYRLLLPLPRLEKRLDGSIELLRGGRGSPSLNDLALPVDEELQEERGTTGGQRAVQEERVQSGTTERVY